MNKLTRRWLIVANGTLIQLLLGTVYAWSYFQNPMIEKYGWSQSQVAWVFSIAICALGLAAAVGGRLLPKYGPRPLALAGGILFGAGYLLAGWALSKESLAWLYLGYGLVGGTGIGLGYVTPVATAARWFDKGKGLATGVVIMGFGLGALVMSKLLAPGLMKWSDGDLASVFKTLGVLFIVLLPLLALGMRNPPQTDMTMASKVTENKADRKWFGSAFVLIWLIFFINILAGIAVIPFQSPMLQELIRLREPDLTDLAARGATLIAISSIFNGLGRMAWGWVSDHLGRVKAFRLLLGSQALVFIVLAKVGSPWMFAVLVCYVMLCYGGGFGITPSFVGDRFGTAAMASAYGAVLTAWSAAGIAGPQLVAILKDRYPENASGLSFTITAILLLIGLGLTVFKGGTLSASPQDSRLS